MVVSVFGVGGVDVVRGVAEASPESTEPVVVEAEVEEEEEEEGKAASSEFKA